MDRARKNFKGIITFRLANAATGEILYELVKEYDLYYLSDRHFLHDKLDDFLQKVINTGGICSYSIEFINSVRPQYFEPEIPF